MVKFTNITQKIRPYKKREVDEFKLLISEAAFLTENKTETTYSENFPPELAGVVGGLGAGTVGVGAVFTIFQGMSGAEIMSALAAFGIPGAVGGIVSIAAAVAAPVILVGGSFFHIANQNRLGRELERLVLDSYKVEKYLEEDNRVITIGLLKSIKEYRRILKSKYYKLQDIY